jgi:cytochrome c-type biogenesis protein CcmH
VTVFILLCAAMLVAAMFVLIRPLLRKHDDAAATRPSALASAFVLAVIVPVITAALYASQSNWNWRQSEVVAKQEHDAQAVVAELERQMEKSPQDIEGWLKLGSAYLALSQPGRAVNAYQKAFDLSNGTNNDAALGLGEALVLADETSIRGRAAEMFELVLSRDALNPQALWYGAIASLAAGKLEVGRDRLAKLIAQNPPQQIREIIERQIQDIDQQLGKTASTTGPSVSGPAQPGASPRSIVVTVSLAPSLAGKFDARTPLFILARDGAGPPLAATRRVVGDLPLTVTLSDTDAMIAGRNLSSVQQATVVARISKSGTPQAQSGDAFGEVVHPFSKTGSSKVDIVIERTVP